jgi:hypothetical protein
LSNVDYLSFTSHSDHILRSLKMESYCATVVTPPVRTSDWGGGEGVTQIQRSGERMKRWWWHSTGGGAWGSCGRCKTVVEQRFSAGEGDMIEVKVSDL